MTYKKGFFGNEKERVEIVAKVISVKAHDTKWGLRHQVNLIHEGYRLIWSATSKPNMVSDRYYKIRATIAKHGRYKDGSYETRINFVRILEEY